VLVKMLDGLEDDTDEPWHACRSAWCASNVDHVSVSLINAAMPAVYMDPGERAPTSTRDVGFVLDAKVCSPMPSTVPLCIQCPVHIAHAFPCARTATAFSAQCTRALDTNAASVLQVLQPAMACAMTSDGGTVNQRMGGCASRCACAECGHIDAYCIYGRADAASFVAASVQRIRRCNEPSPWPGVSCDRPYNEIVVPTTSWEAALPASVTAVICLRGDACAAARDVHLRFVSAYGLSQSEVPLVHYRHDKPAGFQPVPAREHLLALPDHTKSS
jgi:hypothetical protein